MHDNKYICSKFFYLKQRMFLTSEHQIKLQTWPQKFPRKSIENFLNFAQKILKMSAKVQ